MPPTLGGVREFYRAKGVSGDSPAPCTGAILSGCCQKVTDKSVLYSCLEWGSGELSHNRNLSFGGPLLLAAAIACLNCHSWWLGPIVKCQYFHSHPTPLSCSSPWHLSLGPGRTGNSFIHNGKRYKRDCLFPFKDCSSSRPVHAE